MQSNDHARGIDLAGLKVTPRIVDQGLWSPRWSVHKFYDHKGRVAKAGKQGLPIRYLMDNFEMYGHLDFEGNLLLNEGINELWTLVTGTGATKFDSGNAYIGVGTSNTAAQATDTDLIGTKKYNAMDGSYPTYGTSQKATWRSTFASADANFAWEEITVSNTNSGTGKNLNRKCQSMGTKASGTSWVATLEITLS